MTWREYCVVGVLTALASTAGAVGTGKVVVGRTPNGPAQETAVFAPGDAVHLQIEATDFALRDGRPDLNQDIRLVAPMGLTLINQKDAGGMDYVADSGGGRQAATLRSHFVLPRTPAGRWIVKVTVRDKIAGSAAQVEIPIELRPAAEPKR